MEVTRLGYALSGIRVSGPNSCSLNDWIRAWVRSSNPSCCAARRATSSNRHPGWPETAINAMAQTHDISGAKSAPMNSLVRVPQGFRGGGHVTRPAAPNEQRIAQPVEVADRLGRNGIAAA